MVGTQGSPYWPSAAAELNLYWLGAAEDEDGDMENEGQQDMDASSPRSIEDGLPVSHERVLKFEVQLYKATLPAVREGEYMLDIQVRGWGTPIGCLVGHAARGARGRVHARWPGEAWETLAGCRLHGWLQGHSWLSWE